jgi:hypothetical protein
MSYTMYLYSLIDLSDVLQALMLRLKHTIRFDAIAVLVIEGDHARRQELYTEILERKPGESLESFVARLHSNVKVPNTIDPVRPRLKDTHIGAVASSLKPYVSNDLRSERRFLFDEFMMQVGAVSYVSLPLWPPKANDFRT